MDSCYHLRNTRAACRRGILSVIMAGGRLEERVRAWVRQRTLARGARARLAAHLHRQRAWVSKYLNGQVDADFDTTLALADYFSVPIDAMLGARARPRDAQLLGEHRALLDLWDQVPARERPVLRRIIELYAFLQPRSRISLLKDRLANKRRKNKNLQKKR